MTCPFCNLDRKPISETEHMVLIDSLYPVTENGHLLIIPKRHVESFLDLSFYEWIELQTLMLIGKLHLDNISGICQLGFDGFNVGANIGKSGGQTMMHAHFHIIARKTGDVEDPRGGIRNIIPQKGNYLKKL